MTDAAIDNFSPSEVKGLLDESLRPALLKFGFVEDHSLVDLKLVLGFLASAVCAGVGLISNTRPFQQTKSEITIGVVAFFALYSMYLLHVTFVERGIVYTGINKVT